MKRALLSWLTLLVVVGSISLVPGCAYFNLFYNAEDAFSDAEDLGREVDPRNQPTSQQRTQYQLAIRKCQLLIEEHPNSGLVDDALFLMGKSHLRLKEWSDAIRNFDSLLANFPASDRLEETMYLKSLAHFGRGEERSGLEWFGRLREAFPEGRFGPQALFRLGESYAERGDLENAESYYQEYMERYGSFAEERSVEMALVRVLAESERHEEVVEHIDALDDERLSSLERFDARWLRSQSLLALERYGEVLASLDALEESALLPGQAADTRLLRGRVELLSGETEEGLATLDALAAEFTGRSTESDARWVAIEHFLAEGGPEDAVLREHLAASLEGRPSGDSATRMRDLDRRLDRYDDLRMAFDVADSSSDSTATRKAFDIAESLLLDFDRPADALPWYERCLALSDRAPLAPRALYAIAWIESESGDPEAEASFARLEELYPESVQARVLRGEEFLVAKERTPEEIAAMLASSGTDAGSGGSMRSAGGTRASDDPRLAPLRSLRFGGPGALVGPTGGRP